MVAHKRINRFDVHSFLASSGVEQETVEFPPEAVIYRQGDPAAALMYVQKGRVKLSVVSGAGDEAVLGVLGRGDFFGEGCLAGQSVRMGSASAIIATTVLVIAKERMSRLLDERQDLSNLFIADMLARNIRIEEALVDQLFSPSEKRLARILLLLGRYGEHQGSHRVIPKVSQERLAERAGTTRSRVNRFMNKFRTLGFIEYNGELKIHDSLASVVLHE